MKVCLNRDKMTKKIIKTMNLVKNGPMGRHFRDRKIAYETVETVHARSNSIKQGQRYRDWEGREG